MTDPKYLNIPNIQFSLTDKNDGREIKFSKQRINRGFDDSETWSLDSTISKFILPRLKVFNDVKISHPPSITMSEWTLIIKKIITGFELLLKDNESYITGEDKILIEEGLDLFRKHFLDLWW